MQVATAEPPAAGGGAPPDGVYYMTSVTLYTGAGGASGPTGDTRQITFTLSGNGTHLENALQYDNCAGSATGDVSFGATRVSATITCPTGVAAQTNGYTWDATTQTYTLYDTFNGIPEGTTFVPQ
jgi:hypothetical protein